MNSLNVFTSEDNDCVMISVKSCYNSYFPIPLGGLPPRCYGGNTP